MACRVAISWIETTPADSWSARSSTALIAYSPLAEILMRSSSFREQPCGFPREVGDDQVCPGPADRDEGLHHGALLVEPAEPSRRADHRVLAGDGVRGERQPEVCLHPRDDVEV